MSHVSHVSYVFECAWRCFNDFECMIHDREFWGGRRGVLVHAHAVVASSDATVSLSSRARIRHWRFREISTNFDLRSLPEMEDAFVSPRTNMRQRAMVDRSQSVPIYTNVYHLFSPWVLDQWKPCGFLFNEYRSQFPTFNLLKHRKRPLDPLADLGGRTMQYPKLWWVRWWPME